MSISEQISESIIKIQVLLPYMWLSLLITAVAFIVLNMFSKSKWKSKNTIGRTDVFFGLQVKTSFMLAASWIKFITIMLYLCTFVSLDLPHYIYLLLPMLMVCVLAGNVKNVLYAICNIIIQLGGVLVANLIVNYIGDMNLSFGYYTVYALFAILNFLYAGFTFIGELGNISKARKIKTT